jgi:pimeloyl-ACP methyl ester carboxylesterase
MARSKGSYAQVNGLNMYYEIHGEGQPLVLLHGALSAIGTSFGKLLPDLAKERQVIAVEMQGLGHLQPWRTLPRTPSGNRKRETRAFGRDPIL